MSDGYAASFLRALQDVAARDTLAIPPESWDALTPEAARASRGSARGVAETREALLGALPVELRREWEQRLGLEGPEG